MVFTAIAKKIFGTRNERQLKLIYPLVAQINSFEDNLKKLTDSELSHKTVEFRERLSNGAKLDNLLCEAFAVVREASVRTLGMRHFDMQLVGGVVLNSGRIAEMKTGEGKTLVATLPVYLNALEGKGSHVVTVNDYLAKRDAAWMGRIYKFLGMSVGTIVHGMDDIERQHSYRCDITYGTNNEFGFDYLRDNMKFSSDEFVQRDLNFCIVDEVDSILIDEARTPLIISGASEDSTELYYVINGIIPYLKKDKDFTIDEKARSVMLSEEGVLAVEKRLNIDNLYEPKHISILHHVNQGLRAHHLSKLDVDYVIKDGKIVIVDEFTGRLMPGRRWGDGLHQAIEAKEGVRIESENQTLASITFQNFFRMYKKLAGMTGTADTEAEEFSKIYNLEVNVIPTHMPMVRDDEPDVIYKTQAAKYNAVVEEVKKLHEKGQPVLVGTIAIEKSEMLSKMLKRFGVPHHVLNAKQHDREAEIVAQAGRFGSVTISTNMAGRGTDIMLGGNPEFLARTKVGRDGAEEQYGEYLEKFKAQCAEEKRKVIEAGGLFILGTERHESRRIDNQLRGRSGRQGDPGASRFFLSLEDDLLRIFGGERIGSLMDRIGMTEDDEIQHPWLSRSIANAQKKVESHNFQIRKNLLEFDDVMNQQRTTVYGRRREIFKSGGNKDLVLDMIDQALTIIIEESVTDKIDRSFEPKELEDRLLATFNLRIIYNELGRIFQTREDLGGFLFERILGLYEEREARYSPDLTRKIERFILLQTLDTLWKDHLLQMDHLKEGIGLRGYGQKNPLLEYKKEGFLLFREMMVNFAIETVQKLFRVQVEVPDSVERVRSPDAASGDRVALSKPELNAFSAGSTSSSAAQGRSSIKKDMPKVGRNEPCPCGSGKKFKKCCGV